ncbi:MAG TPA: hypothetical protein VNQ97_14585 [Burkholderiaceae bacterium]|nr:hypothetical protein [Burkholderiaceae bacterium]
MLKRTLGLGRHRVLVTRSVPQTVLDRLDSFFDVELHKDSRPLTPDALLERLRDKAGVLSTEHDTIDAAMVAELKLLKTVSNMAQRYDNLDIAALTRAGIMVANVPAASRAAENLVASFGFGRLGGKPADLVNPELLCDCC